MSKLTFASVAMLCLFMTSCAKQEMDSLSINDIKIESRSSENNISVKFKTPTGQDITKWCTQVEVAYKDQNSVDLLLKFKDNTTYTGNGNGIELNTAEGYELDVIADQTTLFEVEELDIDVCSNELCYHNANGTVAGTALDFIVEDIPIGF